VGVQLDAALEVWNSFPEVVTVEQAGSNLAKQIRIFGLQFECLQVVLAGSLILFIFLALLCLRDELTVALGFFPLSFQKFSIAISVASPSVSFFLHNYQCC
jgi:hypothetical protein